MWVPPWRKVSSGAFTTTRRENQSMVGIRPGDVPEQQRDHVKCGTKKSHRIPLNTFKPYGNLSIFSHFFPHVFCPLSFLAMKIQGPENFEDNAAR
jgi:hypothetical protein